VSSRKQQRSLLDMVQISGFDWSESLVHLFVGGSELHGAKVGKTDDTDIYGIYIEGTEVRSGSWTFEKVLRHAQQLFHQVEASVATSPLPEKADRDAISALVARTHLEFWKHHKC